MRKQALFHILVRATRFASRLIMSVLGLFFRKDLISARYSPEYHQQEIWKTEYRIWEANRKEFLDKALPRGCPACTAVDADPLWNTEDGYQYVQCRTCDFVYVTPCFTYDLWREYFERFRKDTEIINRRVIDSRFEENYLNEDRARFSFYLDRLKKHKFSGSVLDIGCLTGSFLHFARERGYEPHGIEHREYAIAAAKKSLDLDLQQGFFEEVAPSMIEGGNRFDIITLWETLEHMLYPDLVLNNARRLLSADGLVAITVPNFDNLQVKIVRERCFHCLGGPGNAGHINMFTPASLQGMLEKNGFKVLTMETEGSSSYYDILVSLSGRFDLLNSYSNAVSPPRKTPSRQPYFLSPVLLNAVLAFSPLWKVAENAMLKGAIILTIARRRG